MSDDSFSEKQARIVSYVQQSRSLLESVCRAHLAEKYVLLYPRPVPAVGEGGSGRCQSATRAVRSGDFKLLAISDEVMAHGEDVEEASLGKMLGTKMGECAAYLDRLCMRVSDKTSKILVTGDVNSGKSTLVNALLRRDLLPTDQQPCTQSFCEVVPQAGPRAAGEKCVHAVVDYERYDPGRRETYDLLGIAEMQDLVQDEATPYQLFRVFVPDDLGNNFLRGTGMNLSLIDSPGLNSDLFTTLSLFSKQEDIDVIVFLINAANHLTLSAREFLERTSQEKAYTFIVVNKFDDIKNREKCKRIVLSQIQEVLPKTYEERSELVHFVSAGSFLRDCLGADAKANADADVASPHSAVSVETRAIMDPDRADASKSHADFIELEDCLRKFIFEKRTKSKLLPAQTYLQRLLGEILGILEYNRRRRGDELCRVQHELEIISPCFDELMAHNGLLQADLRRTVDEAAEGIYEGAQGFLARSGASLASSQRDVPWSGCIGVLRFTDSVHRHVLSASVREMERARSEAISQIDNSLHLLHAVAATHARQIFSSSGVLDDRPAVAAVPSAASLVPPIGAMSLWEIFDGQGLLRGSTWLSAAALAGAAFGYQPLFSLALRVMDLSRRAGRLVTLCLLAAAGGAAVMTLLGDMESIVRERLQRHYAAHFASSLWTHQPSRALEVASRKALGDYHGSLVGRFENALHQQRQLRAEKDLQRCQVETLLSYIDDQFRSTQGLLTAIRQYQL